MTTKRLFTTICTLALTLCMAWAQGPNGSETYYQAANGKKGEELKTAMFNIIKISNAGWSYDGLKTAYITTDTRPDGYLRDWYSNATSYTPGSAFSGGTSAEGLGYNREHLVPQSWFKEASPMKSDIWHVVPSDAKINNERGSDPLGEVGSSYSQSKNGYSKWGMARSGLGYTGKVFEPNDEVKGDIARAYFYMVTCYQNQISNWVSNGKAVYVFDGNTYPGLTNWCLTMMMRWSAIDPVDDIEIARNNVIAAKQNRNPFIDYPGLEDYIWGDKKTVAFSYNNYEGPSTGKQPVTMSFSPTSVTATLGESFTAPTLSMSPSGLTVTYSSSNTNVATVDASTGAVTLKAVGVTIITASFTGNDDYDANSATYTLTVKKQGGDDPTPGGEYTATFNFPENNYGMKVLSSNSSSSEYNPNPTIITSEGISVAMTGDNASRYWMNTNGTYELRVYKACTMTISAPENGKITKIVFAGSTISGILNGGKSLSNGTWTGEENSVVFTFNATQKINTITITYEDESAEPTTTPGDIVKDGKTDWNDLKALVKILLGITPAEGNIDSDAADVNEDGKTNIADVMKLVNMILQNNQ